MVCTLSELFSLISTKDLLLPCQVLVWSTGGKSRFSVQEAADWTADPTIGGRPDYILSRPQKSDGVAFSASVWSTPLLTHITCMFYCLCTFIIVHILCYKLGTCTFNWEEEKLQKQTETAGDFVRVVITLITSCSTQINTRWWRVSAIWPNICTVSQCTSCSLCDCKNSLHIQTLLTALMSLQHSLFYKKMSYVFYSTH